LLIIEKKKKNPSQCTEDEAELY